MFIIHTGTHGQDLNTFIKVKKLVSVIKEIDKVMLELLFQVLIIKMIMIAKKGMIDEINKKN